MELITKEKDMISNNQTGSNKYLTFDLDGEDYALEILKVQEIIGMMTITHVPRMPDYVKGVINLRGRVIPVVDLRTEFGLASKENTERTCIIVVQVSENGSFNTTGVIVDQVYEVVNMEDRNIEPPPSFGSDISTDYILGMGKIKDKVVTIVKIDRIITSNRVTMIESVPQH